jgi:PAS domain S-box-containing protein
MGNLFLGQFFFDDERPDRNLFRKQAQRYGFNEEEYLAALDRVPRWSREKVNAVMTFYSKLAELLSMLSFSNIKLARTLSERDALLGKLRESEEHYRNLAEDIPAFISTFLPDGTLTYVNSSLAAIDGLTPQEMTGRCVYDFLPGGEHRRIIENLKALTPDNPIETHEQRYVREDGRNIIQQWTNRAFFDVTGQVTHFQAIGRDVTEYKMIEDALRESENRNRALLDVIPDLLFIMNANGVFIDYRGAMESLLLAPDVFVGRTIQEMIPEIADRVLAAIGNLFSTRKTQTVEYQLEMNGGMHYYEARLVMMSEEHALAIVRDITGQKKAEQDKLSSDEKYHAFINASLDMVYLKDDEFRYAMINSNLAEYFGKSVESVIGRTDFDLMPPDAADNCRKSDLETLKLNSIVVTEEKVGDRIFETRKFPVTVGGATVIGGFIRDITEMKRTERELELALEQKQALLSELQHADDDFIDGKP